MMRLTIPGRDDLCLTHLALDLNGTLACDGRLIAGVSGRLAALEEDLIVRILTADTYGAAAQIAAALGTLVEPVHGAADKAAFVERVGSSGVVAIGNGANDAAMLAAAALGIAVLGPEGLAAEAFQAADVIAPDITAALDLLLHPKRLVATLRR